MAQYLFIDGAYFREAYERAMDSYFGASRLSTTARHQHFGHTERVYYYDPVDRERVGGETDQQYLMRVMERDKLHANLNSLPNWHVREVTLARTRPS